MMSTSKPSFVPVPQQSRIAALYGHPDLADAYAIDLPVGRSRNPEVLARFLFEQQPAWIDRLLRLRDAIVTVFGLKTSRSLRELGSNEREGGRRVSFFKVYESDQQEIVLGEDDRHLDFRTSLLVQPPRATDPARAIVTTVVHCHNRLGRTYIAVIAPFHRQVVQSLLRRAADRGWPS